MMTNPYLIVESLSINCCSYFMDVRLCCLLQLPAITTSQKSYYHMVMVVGGEN